VEQMAAQALALADRAFVLERGRITLEGSAKAVRRDPAVIEAYLGRGSGGPPSWWGPPPPLGRPPPSRPPPFRFPVPPAPLRPLERLARAPEEAGRVHSVFERAVNLHWHDGHLLTLQGPGPLAAPFAVALASLPSAAALAPGTIVHRYDLDWTDAESVPLDARAGRLAFRAVALPAAHGALTLRTGRGLRARRALTASFAERDAGAFVTAATRLIGLGEGLTPAGDDCVVGALAAIHRLAPGWLDSGAALAIAEAAKCRTTDVARDFLLEALAA